MNEIGIPNYLCNDKSSLIVAAADIEGGRGLPLYSNYLLGKLKHFIKSVKLYCGDCDILKNATPKYFHQVFKRVN